MKRPSHTVWLARWLLRLINGLVRGKQIIDLLPSFVVPHRRVFYDKRTRRTGAIKVRRELSDYWAFDQNIACTTLDLRPFEQGKSIRRLYKAILKDGRRPLIIDCGAHIGCSTYWLAVEFPEAQILAIEPDRENAALAAANTRCFSNVVVLEAAIAAEDCTLGLRSAADGGTDAHRTVVVDGGSVRGVSVATLLQNAGAEPRDLLLIKIDIEGFERELFSRNTEWVAAAGALIVETHDWLLPGQATATPLLRAISATPRDFIVAGEHIMSFVTAEEKREWAPSKPLKKDLAKTYP